MEDKEWIQDWIDNRFGIPNTVNKQCFVDFFNEVKILYPIMYQEEAEMVGWFLDHGWIPPEGRN